MFDKKTNIAAQEAFGAAANSGDYAAFDDLVAADCVDHDPAPGQVAGPDGYKALFAELHVAFPDIARHEHGRRPMRSDDQTRPVSARDYDAVSEAFEDTVAHGPTRRALLSRAGRTLAVLGAGSVLAGHASPAQADTTASGLDCRDADSILTVLTSVETFGVTFLTAAVRRAPGTPSEKFVPVLKKANTAEYDHYLALRRIGAQPLSSRIWIPDALFGGGGIGLFRSIEMEEDIEISAYLVGVTEFAQHREAAGARLCAEALGVEAEHRVVARSAQSMLANNPNLIPNNRGFESYPYRTAAAALQAHEALGIRYGSQGPTPGRFYDFPGDPLDNNTGLPVTSTRPA